MTARDGDTITELQEAIFVLHEAFEEIGEVADDPVKVRALLEPAMEAAVHARVLLGRALAE